MIPAFTHLEKSGVNWGMKDGSLGAELGLGEGV